jgi:L-iditol 2-dehydrogenase
VVVAVGARRAQQESFELLGRGGVVNFFGGLPRGDHMLELDSLAVHYREIRVVGSSGGDPWDMKDTVDLLASGWIDGGNYVYGVGGLQHTIEILERMRERRINGRAILYPHARVPEFMPVDYWDAERERLLLSS